MEAGAPDTAQRDAARELLIEVQQLNIARRFDEALERADAFMARFGASDDDEVRHHAAGVLVQRVRSFSEAERWHDALAACDAVLRWRAQGGGAIEHQVFAEYSRAKALAALERRDEARWAYDDVSRRYRDSQSVFVRRIAADAWYGVGYELRAAGQYDEASDVFAELAARYADDPPLQPNVAQALEKRIDSLSEAGRSHDALAACEDFLARFSDAENATIASRVVRVLSTRAALLVLTDHDSEAEVVADAALQRLHQGIHADLRWPRARALMMKGIALSKEEQWDDAVDVFDELVDEFGDAEEDELREQAVLALVNKAVCLTQLGRVEEALATQAQIAEDYGEVALNAFEGAFRRYADAEDPRVREQAAGALMNKAALLANSDRIDEAIEVLTSLVEKYEDDDALELLRAVAGARELRAELIQLEDEDEDDYDG